MLNEINSFSEPLLIPFANFAELYLDNNLSF